MVTRSPNPLAVVKLSWETIKPTYGQNRYEPPYDPDNRYEHAGDGIIASTILLSVDTSVGGAETMSIMSVSLPDPLVQQMDTLTKERGFAGRSDFVRAAVREFVQQLVSDPMRSGRRSATITLLYPRAIRRSGRHPIPLSHERGRRRGWETRVHGTLPPRIPDVGRGLAPPCRQARWASPVDRPGPSLSQPERDLLREGSQRLGL